jgi:hypothetical protein
MDTNIRKNTYSNETYGIYLQQINKYFNKMSTTINNNTNKLPSRLLITKEYGDEYENMILYLTEDKKWYECKMREDNIYANFETISEDYIKISINSAMALLNEGYLKVLENKESNNMKTEIKHTPEPQLTEEELSDIKIETNWEELTLALEEEVIKLEKQNERLSKLLRESEKKAGYFESDVINLSSDNEDLKFKIYKLENNIVIDKDNCDAPELVKEDISKYESYSYTAERIYPLTNLIDSLVRADKKEAIDIVTEKIIELVKQL